MIIGGRRLVATALLAAVGLLAVGCAPPTGTDVRVDGPPPEAGRAGSGGEADPPLGPDDARDAEELVDLFLQAAANDPETVMEDLRAFIHPSQRDDWEPEPQIYVVREQADRVTTPGEPVRVDLTLRRVGVFANNGGFEPQVRQEEEISFFVSTERPSSEELPATEGRLRLVDPPAIVLLDDSALERYFEARPVYFWDSDQEKLVPDLRWLRRALPERQRPQVVVDWLVAGPAPWLSGSLTALPEGVERVGNVVWDEDDLDTLEVRLTAPHEETDLRTLEAQLWWTLRPDITGVDEVTMVVDGERRVLADDYRASNAVPTEPPASFAVLDGEFWQYVPADSVALPALSEIDSDRDVHGAAVSRDGRHAALVEAGEEGERRLVLAEPREVTGTDLVAGSMGRPLWLNNPSGSGLVVADGELHQFTAGASEVATVELADLPGPVTAVVAAPDGRRLGLVAGDRLWVASVARAGDMVSVSRQVHLPTTATDLSGVAFIREDRLAVVGTARGQSRLFEVTVDGALERELPGGDLGTPVEISSFVAYPGDPTDNDDRGMIMYEADERIWRYAHPQSPVWIDAGDLRGEETATDEEEPAPRAPFFLD